MTKHIAEQVGMLIRNADGSVAWAPWDRLPQEATCPKCGDPIRWCLEMFSFTMGFDDPHPFTLGARPLRMDRARQATQAEDLR